MDWRHQAAATHGVQPVFDPALYDDGGGPAGPQQQGIGAGAYSEYYELCQNDANINQTSPGFPSTSLIDPNFTYYSPPHDTRVQTNTIQTNSLFDPGSGLSFFPNQNSFAFQAPYVPLYHHHNHYASPNAELLSMDLHYGADPAWLTPSSSVPSARQRNHWESVSFPDRLHGPDSFHGDSDHLNVFTSGSQGAITSVRPTAHDTTESSVSALDYYGSGVPSSISPTSISTYQNGQTHNLPNHTPAHVELEVDHSPNFGALSRSPAISRDLKDTEKETISRLNDYTSSNPPSFPHLTLPWEPPTIDDDFTDHASSQRAIVDSSHCSVSSGSGSRTVRSTPGNSTRKRKLLSRAPSSTTKSKREIAQCHVRPLRPDHVDQVQILLRPWFHNQIRCDLIPPELYRGMYKMIDGKEFCAIRGCVFESTAPRRRPGLRHAHANRHLNHKPYYCLSCKKGYGRKEDHGLHPLILASSLPKNPYPSVPSPLTTYIAESETPHTLLA